jgi:hypothetical protein
MSSEAPNLLLLIILIIKSQISHPFGSHARSGQALSRPNALDKDGAPGLEKAATFVVTRGLYAAEPKRQKAAEANIQKRQTKRGDMKRTIISLMCMAVVGAVFGVSQAAASDIGRDRRDIRADRRDARGDRRDIRNDRKDIAKDKRALRKDLRNGNYAAAQRQQRDIRKDQRDLRADRRDLRNDHRDIHGDRRDLGNDLR